MGANPTENHEQQVPKLTEELCMRPTNEHRSESRGYGLQGKRMTARPMVLKGPEPRQICNIRSPDVLANRTDELSVEHVAMLGDK